jgi:hypothetical protein
VVDCNGIVSVQIEPHANVLRLKSLIQKKVRIPVRLQRPKYSLIGLEDDVIVGPSLYDDISLVSAINTSLIHVELRPERQRVGKWEMDAFIDVEVHSPMPPCKFRPADTIERLKTVIQETLAIPLLDQELWCNGKVVGNVPIVKDLQILADAGIKDGGTVHVNMGWNVDGVLIPQWSLQDPWALYTQVGVVIKDVRGMQLDMAREGRPAC